MMGLTKLQQEHKEKNDRRLKRMKTMSEPKPKPKPKERRETGHEIKEVSRWVCNQKVFGTYELALEYKRSLESVLVESRYGVLKVDDPTISTYVKLGKKVRTVCRHCKSENYVVAEELKKYRSLKRCPKCSGKLSNGQAGFLFGSLIKDIWCDVAEDCYE